MIVDEETGFDSRSAAAVEDEVPPSPHFPSLGTSGNSNTSKRLLRGIVRAPKRRDEGKEDDDDDEEARFGDGPEDEVGVRAFGVGAGTEAVRELTDDAKLVVISAAAEEAVETTS